MNYQTFIPHDQLKPFVKFFWLLEDKSDLPANSCERILPDGCLELIFNFGDPFFRVYGNNLRQLQPRSFIHGQIKSFIDVQSSGRTGIIGARFHPSGLSPFIRESIASLNNSAVSLEDIFGRRIRAFEEQIFEAASTADQIKVIETFLISSLIPNQRVDHTVELFIEKVFSSYGCLSPAHLAKKVRISERHLERKFSSLVGLSPKSFQRVIRFQHLLKNINQRKFTSLSQLSFECGYYDQSHFIKDFKEFSGVSPSTYITTSNQLTDFFSADGHVLNIA